MFLTFHESLVGGGSRGSESRHPAQFYPSIPHNFAANPASRKKILSVPKFTITFIILVNLVDIPFS